MRIPCFGGNLKSNDKFFLLSFFISVSQLGFDGINFTVSMLALSAQSSKMRIFKSNRSIDEPTGDPGIRGLFFERETATFRAEPVS
jgi:hypothetical protein